MIDPMPVTVTAFAGAARIASGSLAEVAPMVKDAYDEGRSHLLVIDDHSGRPVELDLRGSVDDVRARFTQPMAATPAPARGRPKLGVTPREVTLLPSHWEWLAQQPGGASAALRRLVDAARRDGANDVREARDTAYRVMTTLAGNASGFEDASRAFFAKDYEGFDTHSAGWPADVRDYVRVRVRRVAALESPSA